MRSTLMTWSWTTSMVLCSVTSYVRFRAVHWYFFECGLQLLASSFHRAICHSCDDIDKDLSMRPVTNTGNTHVIIFLSACLLTLFLLFSETINQWLCVHGTATMKLGSTKQLSFSLLAILHWPFSLSWRLVGTPFQTAEEVERKLRLWNVLV